MIIRNLSMKDGICNLTHLQLIKFLKYTIAGKIVISDNAGKVVLLLCINLDSKASRLPFVLHRQ